MAPNISDDYYFDDPVEDSTQGSSKSKLISLFLVFVLALFGSTYAGNITLGTSTIKEFGQGLLGLSSCSGSNSITLKPLSSFTNASGTGSYKLSAIEVSNVPAGCDGMDFTFSVFDSQTSIAKALHSTDSSTVVVGYRSSSFGAPSGQAGYTVTNTGSGSFKITFSTPVLLASDASSVTIQSTKGTVSIALTCAQGGSCTVGQTGPGGGTVFQYVSAGFNCGPNYNSTGSPTGGLCHYLEVAPAGWYGSANDPAIIWADAAYQASSLSGTNSANGAGYKNSLLILAQGNGLTTTSAGISRSYTGGGLTDWYLPSQAEMNSVITYGTTGTYSAASPGLGLLRGGGTGGYGYYSTSGQHINADMNWIIGIVYGGGGTYKNWTLNVRPIRAF